MTKILTFQLGDKSRTYRALLPWERWAKENIKRDNQRFSFQTIELDKQNLSNFSEPRLTIGDGSFNEYDAHNSCSYDCSKFKTHVVHCDVYDCTSLICILKCRLQQLPVAMTTQPIVHALANHVVLVTATGKSTSVNDLLMMRTFHSLKLTARS